MDEDQMGGTPRDIGGNVRDAHSQVRDSHRMQPDPAVRRPQRSSGSCETQSSSSLTPQSRLRWASAGFWADCTVLSVMR